MKYFSLPIFIFQIILIIVTFVVSVEGPKRLPSHEIHPVAVDGSLGDGLSPESTIFFSRFRLFF